MNRLAKVVAVALVGAASLIACQLIVGVESEEGSAKPDAFAPKIDSAVPDLCAHARIPSDLPDATTEGPDLEPLWFAVSSMDGIPKAGETFGFDLDRVCTGFNAGPTAFDGGGSCLPANPDGDGGIDNAAPSLFRGLPFDYGPKLFEIVSKQVRTGERTLLIYVSRYNGTPNDPYVQVQVVPTDRLATNQCGPDGKPIDAGAPDGAGPAPTWEGCDAWSFATGRLIVSAGSQPAPNGLQDGFVKDGQLVVGTTSSTQLALNVGGLLITATNSFMVANLKPVTSDAGKKLFSLEGVVAGRLATSALFDGVARAAREFCNGPLLETLVKPTVCNARDIAEFPSQDFRDLPCASISAALKITAVQAAIGPEVPGQPLPECDASLPKCN